MIPCVVADAPLLVHFPAPPAEYVKERILALRKQQPGKYQNCSVVRTNAMKCITNYFRKGQLTKLFFLFAVGVVAAAWRSSCKGSVMDCRPRPVVLALSLTLNFLLACFALPLGRSHSTVVLPT